MKYHKFMLILTITTTARLVSSQLCARRRVVQPRPVREILSFNVNTGPQLMRTAQNLNRLIEQQPCFQELFLANQPNLLQNGPLIQQIAYSNQQGIPNFQRQVPLVQNLPQVAPLPQAVRQLPQNVPLNINLPGTLPTVVYPNSLSFQAPSLTAPTNSCTLPCSSPVALVNPFLPAASPISALAPPTSNLLPPASPTGTRNNFLRKIPIPPPMV